MKKKSITQEHPSGCAVACVAYIIGNSYKNALKLFKRPDYATSLRGYYCREIIKALKNAGLKYNYCYAKPSKLKLLLLDNIIVFIARSKKYPTGHYLARRNKKWMNPWINFPNIKPAKSGFSKILPGKVQWIIFPLS